MSKKNSSSRCPQGLPATVDDEGFCSLHGWDCGDYSLSFDREEDNDHEEERNA